MFRAHRQEADCTMWRMVFVLLLSRLGRAVPSHPGPLTVDVEAIQVTFVTSSTYTRPPDYGLQMGPKHVEWW
jgi:hypothetical protein